MKSRWLIILSALFLMGLSVSCGIGQKKDQKMSESKKIIINVDEIGEKMDVPLEPVIFPDGTKFNMQKWGKEHIKQAITELNRCFDGPENTYLLTQSPAPWVTLALIEALQPLKVLYLYPRADGVDLDMCELERGDAEYNYDVVFEIIEEGEDLFINLNSDRPEAVNLGHHTFDTENLYKIVIPEILSGRHVFIHGKGMFCVTVCVARNYLKDSKSVSIAAHDTDYQCAVSYTDEIESGDVRPRTIPNNL